MKHNDTSKKRYHRLRRHRNFIVSRVLGRSFSRNAWFRYCDEKKYCANEAVATVNGYEYNVYDVCLNATKEMRLELGRNYLEVSYAVMPDGRLNGGENWQILTSGGCSGVVYREHGEFESKNALVTHYLEIFEKRLRDEMKSIRARLDYDEDGNVVNNTPSIQLCKRLLTEVEKKKEYYHPRQLSLF